MMTAVERARLVLPVGPSDHVEGPATAPVTLVEYGDYECSHCGRAYPIVKRVQRAMESRLRFVFRNFPLTRVHPHAQHAAEAAEAAASQRKFWPMHDRLFEHQLELEDEDLVAHALAVGLDVDRFSAELLGGAHVERVREDFKSGLLSGVNGTPTFFVNGVRYDASWDHDTLLAVLLELAETTG